MNKVAITALYEPKNRKVKSCFLVTFRHLSSHLDNPAAYLIRKSPLTTTLVISVNIYTVRNKRIFDFFYFCFGLSAFLIENLLIWVIQKAKQKT